MLKYKEFSSPYEMCEWVNTQEDGGLLIQIESIIQRNDCLNWILFYRNNNVRCHGKYNHNAEAICMQGAEYTC